MKATKSILLIFLVSSFFFQGCTTRLIDFTFISSKNTNFDIPMDARGERVSGKHIPVLGIGASIKEAMDRAIEKAGPEYDAIVDGVLEQKYFILVAGFSVEGTPVNTREIKASLGQEKFQDWASENDLKYHSDRKNRTKR